MPVVDPERFAGSLTWEAFLARSEKNVNERRIRYDQVQLSPEDAAFFASLRPLGLKVLVLDEDW